MRVGFPSGISRDFRSAADLFCEPPDDSVVWQLDLSKLEPADAEESERPMEYLTREVAEECRKFLDNHIAAWRAGIDDMQKCY